MSACISIIKTQYELSSPNENWMSKFCFYHNLVLQWIYSLDLVLFPAQHKFLEILKLKIFLTIYREHLENLIEIYM